MSDCTPNYRPPVFLRSQDCRQTRPSTEKICGEAREITFRAPAVTKGYWKRPEATAKNYLPEGWFQTGNVGNLDTDNRLFINERKKDLIAFSGWKGYSTEVEDNPSSFLLLF